MNIADKEAIEINYWKNSLFEAPDSFTKRNRHNKRLECEHFHYKIKKHKSLLIGKSKILEVGAGQGWASCFLKRFYLKNSHFTATDISEYAIKSLKYWEQDFAVKLDNSYACRSYEIPEDDGAFDLIFCYAAAHHFVEHEKTLLELKRLLGEDGLIIYFYEPTCSKLFYPIHHWIVNRDNTEGATPEDILVLHKMKNIASSVGLELTSIIDPHQTIVRSKFSSKYYKLLERISFLNNWLPTSSDLLFKKKKI